MALPAFDTVKARAETPGTENLLHFNNAGASLVPTPVLDTVIGHLRREAEIGGYEAHDEALPRLEDVYDSVARLIGCHRDEVALIENATRAWDMAFYALPFTPGDRILTAEAEYASNVISFLQVVKNRGVVLDVIPNDEHGQVSVEALESMIGPRVKLIAITHVPTQGGLVNPASAIGAVARKHGVPFLLDACQSVGQMPIDVKAIGCDMLSATGRKFLRAPRGTGFLYVRRDWIEKLEPPFLDLYSATWSTDRSYTVRPDARRFENWESYVAGRLGLGAAIDYAMQWGLEAIQAYSSGLADKLRVELSTIPGVTVRDQGVERCAIVTFNKEGTSASSMMETLRKRRINVSVSKVTSARFDLGSRGLAEVVRVSPHYFNTDAEVRALTDAIRDF